MKNIFRAFKITIVSCGRGGGEEEGKAKCRRKGGEGEGEVNEKGRRGEEGGKGRVEGRREKERKWDHDFLFRFRNIF